MLAPPAPKAGVPLILIEGCLTAIAIAVAFAAPRLGDRWFTRVERAFRALARRKRLSVIVVGVSALLLRLALLPVSPIPNPCVNDDFSFFLAAETFLSGRLTNPTPAMWVHFETVHETMRPTYQTMYFPAQGLVMAAGKALFGHPWYGILIVTALMCAAICWMLQAWLPPEWALLGGFIVVLRIGLFSYWIDTYSGAGSICALGGALILGGLPRFMKTVRLRDGLLMAIGVVLLGTCRLYEGMLLCIPVAIALVRWAVVGKNRPAAGALFRRIAFPLLLIVAGAAWMGYYDYRAFGSPSTLPYTADRSEYAVAPYFVWQHERPVPVYRNDEMRRFYTGWELTTYKKIHSPGGFVPETLLKLGRAGLFYVGIVLLVPLVMLRRVYLDRRIRFLVLCVMVLMAGQLVEIYFIPHYVAPFTAAFYAIGLQAMRHLRLWRPGNQPVGRTLVRLVVVLCVVLGGVRVSARPLHLALPVWPLSAAYGWYGWDASAGSSRAQVEANLEQRPGPQLAIIRYAPNHSQFDEWVYNNADIDHSKVIWARDMGATENEELIRYYKDRTVWLVQPDVNPVSVTPYR